MKRTKTNNIKIDWAGTKKVRLAMAKQKFVKITINVDADSLSELKAESEKTGVPYQRLLNSLLKENLSQRRKTEGRLEKLEKELALVKKKFAA
jgi:predicted DNA binding CopG/RHH family protein